MALRIRPGIAACVLTIPGILSFVFAVLAESMKRAMYAPGLIYDPVVDKNTCHYGKDPSLYLGILSVIALFMAACLSFTALFYPYGNKPVSSRILWESVSPVVFCLFFFFNNRIPNRAIYFASTGLTLAALVTEYIHRHNNVHSGILVQCPTAKAGLFGGAGFLALDATLFFLISLMLTTNVRSDYSDVEEADDKGSYGEVTTEVPPPGLNSPEA